MAEYTDAEVATWDRDAAEARISEEVYRACALIEKLERAGKIRGNGHHLRQDIAGWAQMKLRERFIVALDEDTRRIAESYGHELSRDDRPTT